MKPTVTSWHNRRLIGAKKFLDGLNRPVPPRLAPVFIGRDLLNRWLNDLMVLRVQMAAWNDSPFTEECDAETIIAKIDDIAELVRNGVPYQGCWCPADELDCPLCKGKRWLSVGKVIEESARLSAHQSLVASQSGATQSTLRYSDALFPERKLKLTKREKMERREERKKRKLAIASPTEDSPSDLPSSTSGTNSEPMED